MTPDLLLVGHGSRDPAAAGEFEQLTTLVRDAAPSGTRVGAGFLELAEPHVDAALDRLVADGATDIAAVPYVLFGAGHLKDDGPAILARAAVATPTSPSTWPATSASIPPSSTWPRTGPGPPSRPSRRASAPPSSSSAGAPPTPTPAPTWSSSPACWRTGGGSDPSTPPSRP